MIDKINIGGGSDFCYPGWLNLDSTANPPFAFGPSVEFPVPSNFVQLVYSSHCLEHLDDDTVDRVLAESYRTMRSDARLLLKLPDFDRVLQSLRIGDNSFFYGSWAQDPLTQMWSRWGVQDTVEMRASMIFCGWWNAAYGNPFSGPRRTDRPDAYHGPARVSVDVARELMSRSTPHEIARALRARVVECEVDYIFNHQNAWSLVELTTLLNRAGFVVTSTDKGRIVNEFSHIPDIRAMFDISLYCLCARYS